MITSDSLCLGISLGWEGSPCWLGVFKWSLSSLTGKWGFFLWKGVAGKFQGAFLPLGISYQFLPMWGSLGPISQGPDVQTQGASPPVERVSPNGCLTMSWKKNQACCRTASRTALPLTTHCRASSS